tara:strand:- start:41 stop:469 length:429 start_codon:yes stop_codon:yes gene_type:complete
MKISIIKEYNEEISKFLFNLRNKNFVRRSSLSKTKIKLHQHKTWIKKFFKRKNILYVVRIKDKPVGYIRMEKNRNYFDVSWALEKKYQGKGIAKKFLKTVTKKRLKLRAIIESNNLVSLNIAKYSDFKIKISKEKLLYLYKN